MDSTDQVIDLGARSSDVDAMCARHRVHVTAHVSDVRSLAAVRGNTADTPFDVAMVIPQFGAACI